MATSQPIELADGEREISGVIYSVINGRLHWYDDTRPVNERWTPDETREELEQIVAEAQAKLEMYEEATR